MKFTHDDVPVAYAMVTLAGCITEPFQAYMCYWVAFNNMYVTIARYQGCSAKFSRNRDTNEIKNREVYGMQMPVISTPSEDCQIKHVVPALSTELKRDLILCENTRYFVNRVSSWLGQRVETDQLNQKLNGVINVTRTLSKNRPVWSPINPTLHRRYSDEELMNQITDAEDILTEQILFVLYTIRNNTFHGGKQANCESDREVVENALPLLKKVVEDLLIS